MVSKELEDSVNVLPNKSEIKNVMKIFQINKKKRGYRNFVTRVFQPFMSNGRMKNLYSR